ncbi:nucleoside monophosphate kinase [Candidatus Gracilibacteria bacterium]|nr:nucleoside monophosphate kinase [Candidatus Gracilibacteria bacterium]
MKLVFTGIQGSGKGTQARKLVELYNFKLLEMGGEFRRVIASGSELGKKIQEQYDRGDQVSPDLGVAVMEDAVQNIINNHSNENVIFDAFIRNDWNKEIFDRLLPDYSVILFELSEEKARDRLLGRMFNPTSGETFPGGTLTDPKTGETLIQRADDNESGIIKRIELYRDITLPIVEQQKAEGRVIEINADQSPDEVFQELVGKLSL